MKEPKADDPITEEIPCECGGDNCDVGLIVGKYPGGKVKLKIIDKEDIKTVVVDKTKLLKKLNEI